RGHVRSARDAQRQAADHVEQAARNAADLTAALRADMSQSNQLKKSDAAKLSTAESESSQSGDLQTARAAQAEADRSLDRAAHGGSGTSKSDAAAASSAMREAAKGMRAVASRGAASRLRMAQSQGAAGAAEPSNPTPSGSIGSAVEPHLGALDSARMDRSGRRWGDLPGHLREEMDQLNHGRYRADYERLIRLYFREIADPEQDRPSNPLESDR